MGQKKPVKITLSRILSWISELFFIKFTILRIVNRA
jgi:hypothetical protein